MQLILVQIGFLMMIMNTIHNNWGNTSWCWFSNIHYVPSCWLSCWWLMAWDMDISTVEWFSCKTISHKINSEDWRVHLLVGSIVIVTRRHGPIAHQLLPPSDGLQSTNDHPQLTNNNGNNANCYVVWQLDLSGTAEWVCTLWIVNCICIESNIKWLKPVNGGRSWYSITGRSWYLPPISIIWLSVRAVRESLSASISLYPKDTVMHLCCWWFSYHNWWQCTLYNSIQLHIVIVTLWLVDYSGFLLNTIYLWAIQDNQLTIWTSQMTS